MESKQSIDTLESMLSSLANGNVDIKNYDPVLLARGGLKLDADRNHTLIIIDRTEKDKVLKLARMVHKIHPDIAENILADNYTLYTDAKHYAMTARGIMLPNIQFTYSGIFGM